MTYYTQSQIVYCVFFFYWKKSVAVEAYEFPRFFYFFFCVMPITKHLKSEQLILLYGVVNPVSTTLSRWSSWLCWNLVKNREGIMTPLVFFVFFVLKRVDNLKLCVAFPQLFIWLLNLLLFPDLFLKCHFFFSFARTPVTKKMFESAFHFNRIFFWTCGNYWIKKCHDIVYSFPSLQFFSCTKKCGGFATAITGTSIVSFNDSV